MSYKLLALDLDGTLTDDEKKITPRTKRALTEAMEMGVKLVLASGRPDIGISALAQELDMYSYGGYILAFNGARIIDCKTNSVVFENAMDAEYYKDIIGVKQKFDSVEVITYSDKGILTEKVTDWVNEEKRCLNCGIELVDDLLSALPERVIKFLIVGKHEKLLPVKEYFEKNYAGKFEFYFSQPFFLEVVPLGIDKANSLKWLKEYCGIQSEELMACGDGYNDIPMLKEAGLPVAMDNAYPEVKPYAKYITADNNHDGVGLAVEKFILGKED